MRVPFLRSKRYLTVHEIVYDFLVLLFYVGLVGVALLVFINVFLSPFGLRAGFSEGFSMCRAESTGVDYLSLYDTYCAYAPGDLLIVDYCWPPEVNDVACVYTKDGIVCHRVYLVTDGKACFVGDNANWTLCFGPEEYFGKVVAKLPRAVGYPAFAVSQLKYLLAFKKT